VFYIYSARVYIYDILQEKLKVQAITSFQGCHKLEMNASQKKATKGDKKATIVA